MADPEVHSFHINVGNGDAAIHLLVQPGTAVPPATDAPPAVVQRAILVDGGQPAAIEQIRLAIRFIEATYDVSQQENITTATGQTAKLAFDGFVISRWAADHSDGLLNLIVQQLLEDHPSTGSGATATGSAGSQQAQCSLMKYSGTTPATYIYSPYWTGVGASNLLNNGDLAPTQQIVLDSDEAFALDNEARLVDIQQGSITWSQVCYLLVGSRELIGREFFTGKTSSTPSGTSPRWYGDVASMVTGAGAGNTGVFCIGADGTIPQTTSNSFQNITLDPIQHGIPSIILVAIVNGQIQHYFSGDSDYQADEAAASWINGTISVMKLSSHGSLVSWPHKIGDTLKPQHFICSAGQSTDGIHPRWELLLLLNALVQKWNAAAAGSTSPTEVQRWFHPTNYPIYFVQNEVGATNPPGPLFNFDAFAKTPSGDNVNDVLGFQSMLQQADNNLLAMLRETLSDVAAAPADQTRFIIDYLRNIWPSMSYSTAEQHPVPGSTTQGIVVSPQTQLLFVLAKLASPAVNPSVSISYVNGAWKTLVNSESPPALSTDLDPGKGAAWTANGYKGPNDQTARGASLAVASATKLDTAPQGVKLPPGAKAINEGNLWVDKDDITPSENYVDLIQKIYPSTPLNADDVVSIFGSTEQPAVWVIANAAYPKLTLSASNTDIRVLQDSDSMAKFVTGLATGFIGLPQSTGSVTLDATKDLWGFYMGASMISTSISLTLDTTGTIKTISMACTLFSGKTLTFNTDQNAAQFGVSWPTGPTSCTIPGTNVVVVGLVADTDSNSTEMALSDILKAFQAYPPADSTQSKLRSLLNKIGENINMKLEPVPATGEDPLRNAIWCTSGPMYSFTLRLTWSVDPANIDDVLNSVAGFLLQYLNLKTGSVTSAVDNTLKAFRLEAQITGTYHPTIAGGYHIVTESELTFSTGITVGTFSLGISLTIANNGDFAVLIKGGSGLSSYLSAAQSLGSTDSTDTSISKSQSNLPKDVDQTNLALASIWISRDDQITTYGVNFVLALHQCPISFSYSSTGIFSGALIIGNPVSTSDKLLPSYDPDKDASALIPASTTPSTGLPIETLWGGSVGSLPNGMPDLITQAAIEYNRVDPSNPIFSLSAVITRGNSAVAANKVPAFEIDMFTVNFVKSTATTLSLSTNITINGAPSSNLPPATLTASIRFSSTQGWSLQAHLESFRLGLLFSHFPSSFQNAATSLIGKLDVEFVDIAYTYDAASGAVSSFLISGAISLGQLELRLFYQYSALADQSKSAAALGVTSADTTALGSGAVLSGDGSTATGPLWKFQAYLGSTSTQQSTIGSILESIDAGLSKYLPSFVNNTTVQPASGNDAPVKIEVTQTKVNGVDVLFFVAHLHLGDATISFIQLNDDSGTSPPKRILRVSVSTLPLVAKIPLVNQLPQPFDDLEYVWALYPAANASDGAPESSTTGFSPQEMSDINAALTAQNIPVIPIKDSTRADPNSTGQPASPPSGEPTVALAAGQHFVVVHQGNVILDYVFGAEDPSTATPQDDVQKLIKTGQKKAVRRDLDPGDPPSTDQPVTKGSINSKPSQFLTISNIGLSYSDGVLWLDMDATVMLGPITFALLGFGLGFDIASLGKTVNGASNGGLRFNAQVAEDLLESVRLTLHGAELSFSQPPLAIGGVFIHNNSNGVDSYAGGLTISIPPYTLVAVGEYDKVAGPPEYKSVFIFAKLDGPLFSIGFATVEGVRAGFGYNSFVQTPTLDQLTSFPFISDSIGSNPNDPLAVLQAMQKYVMPQDGTFWGAVGMKINALDIISASAVAVVEYSPQGLDISIFVDAVLQMPPGEPSDPAILYVEASFLVLSFTYELTEITRSQ